MYSTGEMKYKSEKPLKKLKNRQLFLPCLDLFMHAKKGTKNETVSLKEHCFEIFISGLLKDNFSRPL
jgi:hypothetical protein